MIAGEIPWKIHLKVSNRQQNEVSNLFWNTLLGKIPLNLDTNTTFHYRFN